MNLGNIKNMVRRMHRYGIWLSISNLILVYGRRHLPPSILKKTGDSRNKLIRRKVSHYLPAISDPICTPTPLIIKDNAIWVCWLQGEEHMPELVRICWKSIQKNSAGHDVVLLSLDNYSDYVLIPPVALNKYIDKKLSHAHFADIIRMNLLAQQGGLWLDATMLLTAPVAQSIFDMPFFSIKTRPQGYFVSDCRWAVFTLACKRGCDIMPRVAKAFENYMENNDILIDYFLFDHFIDILYRTDATVRQIIDAVPFNNPDVHALRTLIAQDYNEPLMNKMTESTQMFKLNTRTWSPTELESNPKSLYQFLKKI